MIALKGAGVCYVGRILRGDQAGHLKGSEDNPDYSSSVCVCVCFWRVAH